MMQHPQMGKYMQPMPPDNTNNLHKQWADTKFPASMLSADNVMDYFAASPFWERNSDNQILKMQGKPVEMLAEMVGVQFHLHIAQEPLFVIRKVKRISQTQVSPLAVYHIIDGNVYQSPDLASIINYRALAALNPLREAFHLAAKQYHYHPSKGYTWQFDKKLDVVNENSDDRKPEEKMSTLYQRTRVDSLLTLITNEFPPPTQSSLDGVESIPKPAEENGSQSKQVKSETEPQ